MNIAQQSKVIKNKVGLLRLAEQLDSVSKACKVMGLCVNHKRIERLMS